MTEKNFPLDKARLEELTRRFPTPFHIYDEKGIRENARRLKRAFSIFPGFREFFAVKACPNPFLLKILADEGFGADCSSYPELLLSEKAGISGEMVMFTSNETPASEFAAAKKLGAIINLDDLSHLAFLEKALADAGDPGLPELLCFRYNPGPLKEGNAIIGKPEEAKYGLTREQIFEAYAQAKAKGVKRFGLHTMVASNELNPDYFVETAVILFELMAELKAKLGIRFEFVNLGGGFGIPYRPEQKALDFGYIAGCIRKAYDRIVVPAGLDPLAIYMETGRTITGPYGWLVTRAIHEKRIYRHYIGVDASMADLMRPGMYGAYHHVTVAGKEGARTDRVYDVVGSLCENCDKFAVQRPLPEIKIGDLVIVHDTGAHGRAMCFNYNGKLRSGELLLRTDGTVVQIRRRETVEDYFATLDLAALKSFNAKA